MSETFRERIRQAIANPVLQAALDANARRRVEARARVLASLPDYAQRRARAAALRREVIDHLDDYLARFAAQAAAHGLIVHRAADAAEARRLVLDIVRAAGEGQRLVAKSKSMVSEEMGLNEALLAAGHEVVETDLGEYIVQLRGEKPSHIITPAVHLRRQEVAQLFHEKLGIPYSEDVAVLTAAARRRLREVFLRADVGISGVNFGVAQNGALTIVTNEGNGRMVTTLPRVHIAVMGMERLVPDMDALALMLSLLPRSATGQKISVYTQIIRQPLPGQKRHLIILDNGRTALRASPLQEALACIRCGACLNACPAFREIGGHAYHSVYPGPIGSVISPALFGADHSVLAYACSLCGACAEVCPVEVPLPDLLVRVRAGRLPQPQPEGAALPPGVRWSLRAFSWAAQHPRWFAGAQRLLGWLFGGRRWLSLPAWTGWGLSKDLPAPAQTPFRALWRENQPAGALPPQRGDAVPAPRAQPVSGHGVARFRQEVEALSGEVISVREADLTAALAAWLSRRGVTRLQAAPDAKHWLDGVEVRVEASADETLPAGLTRAAAAVAETGSLLILGDDRDTLAASLLPPVHLAVLFARDVYEHLEEVLRLPVLQQARAAALVSGPSRTADIEMTLTIGVHGPGELIIFLVDE